MPTISVARDALFAALGKTYTEDEFQDLCFEFGIELDEVVTEAEKTTKTRGAAESAPVEETMYKIEVPANRYDILCLEGLARALNVFLGNCAAPEYTMRAPAGGSPMSIAVEPETAAIRPFIVGAVLRDCRFSERAYNSLLDLQDRLHHNICRRRTLVAIGTHDLDVLTPPFRYRAMAPRDINFVPLAQTRSFNAEELFAFYNEPGQNSPLKKFLPILEGAPRYPAVVDAEDRVLSLPPIINGNHSRISAATKNMLIECTCTDLTKGSIVLNTLVSMFSEYSSTPFSVEPVEVRYPAGASHPKLAGQSLTYPDLAKPTVSAEVAYMQRAIGLPAADLPGAAIPGLLRKMMLDASLSADGGSVRVSVPITRPDVMHACDVMEDVAVAYSFNKIPRTPAAVGCTGSQQPLSKLTDLMRLEMAQAGFTEALTFALCSHDEAFAKMRRADDGKSAVVIANPKTVEFQVCRTSLLPGLFKTLGNNKSNPLPWKLFEISDSVHVDATADVGASNRRRLALVYSDSNTSGFEVMHGLVERTMAMLGLKPGEYTIRPVPDEADEPTYLPGRAAQVVLRPSGRVVGHFGTVHPEVLEAFDLEFPTSAVDIDLEAFLARGVVGAGAADELQQQMGALDVSDPSGGDVVYADVLRTFVDAGISEMSSTKPADPYRKMYEFLFQASLVDYTTSPAAADKSKWDSDFVAKFGLPFHGDAVIALKGKGTGPKSGVRLMLADAGDFFSELSKKMKATGAPLTGTMTAEELKAADAAATKMKIEKLEKEQAERDAADAINAVRSAEMEASGKKVSGGLHKFDASEVDVNGGSATADDLMDAFGF